MLIIKTEEDRERCTSCYGNRTIELTMEEVVFYGEMAFLTKSYHSRIIVDFNKLALAIYNAGYRKEDSQHAEN